MRARWIWCVLTVLPAGCLAPIETPSAYDSQRFLCSAENDVVFQEELSTCREDALCGGVGSFAGTLQGQELTVESTQSSTVFFINEDETSKRQLSRVDTIGKGPYFQFMMKLKGVGGNVDLTSEDERTLTFDSSDTDNLTDDRVSASIRLSVGGESINLLGLDEQGQLVIEHQSRDEISFRFEGSFGDPSDRIEGCFTVLTTETRIE